MFGKGIANTPLKSLGIGPDANLGELVEVVNEHLDLGLTVEDLPVNAVVCRSEERI